MRSSPSLALLVLVACGSSARDVDVERVTPPSGTSAAAIAVQLDGSFGFDLTSDLDTGEHGVATLSVLVGDTPLTDVVWHDANRIDGVIPAGLEPGRYDVVVRIGAREGRLAEGFAITGANLAATLALPGVVGRGSQTTVTMTVTNDGIAAATMAAPSALMTSGTSTATLVTDATGGASIAPGASITFEWTYRMDTVGTIAFAGHATATDELTGFSIASPVATSNMADVVETTTVIADPLGDSSSFGYVVGYAGHVYIGPNDEGATVSRVQPDGTGLETNLAFTFARDVTGNQHANATTMPLGSIGYTGCTLDTSQCGPDNENARGTFAAGMLGGTQWLVLGGAKVAGDVNYIYMTTDTDSTLDFRYVDLSAYTDAQTHGFAAAHFLGDRLYLSFPDIGSGRPYLLALQVAPDAPGLDASGQDVLNMGADQIPGFNSPSPAMIDSFGDLDGLLYIGSSAGLWAATTASPAPYQSGSADWANAAPTPFPAWFSRTSFATSKTGDLVPADRAIPQIASFGGRLFFGRNTTAGPQLWACDPAKSTSPTRCEPGDWELAAPNASGDVYASQLNNASLTKITMVVATPQFLYIGFDSAQGVQVFRTTEVSGLLPEDFEGHLGCRANEVGCVGIGGVGLGDPADTMILDAKALTFGTQSAVWITVGDGVGPARLVMIP